MSGKPPVTITLPAELAAELEAEAKAVCLSVPAYIRYLLARKK